MSLTMDVFATRLLNWYRMHGRHDLPWQKDKTLYRVWVSEIMLQQTQVATVIPYYQSFMQRFKNIGSLAQSPQDDVLLHWAGLGYYSRARNLHKTAQVVQQQHAGKFPQQYDQVLVLPGIGPSTAGAILAQALGQRHSILDGNVKRVLARHGAIAGWSGQSQVAKQLWLSAEKHTPQENVADYTQAIMDLGATICTRSSAKCEVCPLSEDCIAYQQDMVSAYPDKKPKKILPVREKRLLIIQNENGDYMMEKRPPTGIWGGLWSLPELALDDAIHQTVKLNWQLTVNKHHDLPTFRHTFSHFHLDITPCEVRVEATQPMVAEESRFKWCADINQLALAAPVRSILQARGMA